MDQNLHKNEDIKEEFCGACVAIPLAFAGVGAGVYGSSSSRGSYKNKKKVMMWSGIISIFFIIISIIVAIYFLCIKKCKECTYTG